jgi:hypothetical protein
MTNSEQLTAKKIREYLSVNTHKAFLVNSKNHDLPAKELFNKQARKYFYRLIGFNQELNDKTYLVIKGDCTVTVII